MRRLALLLLALAALPLFAQQSGPPYRVGGDVKAPVVIKRVEPVYTEEGKANGITGIVIVETVVDRNGDVTGVKVLKPLPFGLDQAAADAVKQWKFRPGTLNGEPVDVLFMLTVNFRLDEKPSEGPQPGVTSVILVRHAEKATTGGDDPPLTAEGTARAERLAKMLGGVPVTAIYTTPFERTRKTAEPLAQALKLTPIEVKTGETYAAEIVRRIVAQAGGTFVVVGHTNTTRNVLSAFGVPNPREIPETEYDNLYILTLAPGVAPRLLSLKY